MDFYDQSDQACFVLIPHSYHEKGMGRTHNTLAKFVLSLLIDLEILFCLNVVMLMLKVVHSFIKFAQLKDIFVYDFISLVKAKSTTCFVISSPFLKVMCSRIPLP
jgi:hypothetical protein